MGYDQATGLTTYSSHLNYMSYRPLEEDPYNNGAFLNFGLDAEPSLPMMNWARGPKMVAVVPGSTTKPLQHRQNDQLPQIYQMQGLPVIFKQRDAYSQSVDACRSKVSELFPDISHVFVEELCVSHGSCESYRRGDLSYIDKVIDDILGRSPYPKERRGVKRKAPTEQEDDDDCPGPVDGSAHTDARYVPVATMILANEFRRVPYDYIRKAVADSQWLYVVYLQLTALESSPEWKALPYERLRLSRKPQTNCYRMKCSNDNQLVGETLRELETAKKKVARDAAMVRKEKEDEEAERHNEDEHARAGTLVECQCCFLDNPPNRSILCERENAHFFCYLCIRKAAATQIGLMRYELRCLDTSGCQAGFQRYDLREALGDAMMNKLDSLQQDDEISRAGLDGLEGCPFCEFKAVCAPVQENREFLCCNPACSIVSCRLCKEETHVPKTCEEAKKDKGVLERHRVEEAMTEAAMRKCPRCKVKLVKGSGCNKITCSKCACVMCYLCGKDIARVGYSHFGRQAGACRVDDSTIDERIRQEVVQAEMTTVSRIQAENPDLKRDDLLVSRADKTKSLRRHSQQHDDRLPTSRLLPAPAVIYRQSLYQRVQHQDPIPGIPPDLTYRRVASMVDNRHTGLPTPAVHMDAPYARDSNPSACRASNRITSVTQDRLALTQHVPAANSHGLGNQAARGVTRGGYHMPKLAARALVPSYALDRLTHVEPGRVAKYPRTGTEDTFHRRLMVDLIDLTELE